jgi:gliding motility-associated lipoprotein GldH
MSNSRLKTILTVITQSAGRINGMVSIICLMLVSCKSGTLFDDNKSLPGNVWKADKILRFEVGLQDTLSICKFYLNVRHTTNYRYSNLFLFINTTFPDGKEARDTVECILADPSGKWLGKGISNVRDNQVLLRRGIRFPQQGRYIFELEQAMRENELQGIMDVGLRIVKE